MPHYAVLSPSPVTFSGVRHLRDVNAIDADVVVIGAPCATPYLHNPDYAAANLHGPTAIRKALERMGWRHDRVDWDVGTPPLLDKVDRVVDIGDLPLSTDQAEANRKLLHSTIQAVVRQGAVPLVLGGDDSVPIPVVQALSSYDPLVIMQLDAHIDWRDEVNGERWGLSSGMRRASELPFVKKIIQVGMRGPSSAGPQEVADAKAWGVKFFTSEQVTDNGVAQVLAEIPDGAHIHINFDLDVLDPSIMPAVFVPTPGGLLYWHVSKLIRGVSNKADLVSLSMIEFMAARDPSGIAARTAGQLAMTAVGEVLRARYRH